MDEAAIALGLIGSASVLYGLYLVYYTFARSLQHDERTRIYDSLRGKLLSPAEAKAGLIQLENRRIMVGALILAATFLFELTVLPGLLWVACQCSMLLTASGIGFAVLALLAIPFAVFALGRNVQEALEERQLLEGRRE